MIHPLISKTEIVSRFLLILEPLLSSVACSETCHFPLFVLNPTLKVSNRTFVVR